ncbi:MAG: adenosylcobalamin-dependent ribonucleoside-diphosphate reductase [Verrucomicrobiota bacterium]|nr:adenosylcobalamin-dependent ribonucleoside-diphosphate reductase [Verrucomicrobiota bacterium]
MSTTTAILPCRFGAAIQLPERKNLLGGLKIERCLSSEHIHPYAEISWEKRDIRIMDWATGKARFERPGVEVPAHWDENAATVVADKYLFGRDPGGPEYEDSFRQIFDRIANTYTVWGWEEGYFASLEDAAIFNEELKAMLVRQLWAPNSPVWFNIGHWEQWRWHRPDLRRLLGNRGNKAYYATGSAETPIKTHELDNVYERPQCSACFLTEVDDKMEDILEHLQVEGRIFASGSGVGINVSTMRSSYEPITGKGKSSGPVSFDRGWDRMAGAIKSGGKTRRAARMVIMYGDHPDIFKFINAKNDQEKIAKIILREHNVRAQLVELARKKRVDGDPAERAAAEIILALPAANNDIYDKHMDGLLYGDTLAHQNANHSISLKGDFWQAYHAKGQYSTRWVTKPERVQESFPAEKLLDEMARCVHENGEPGQHNNDWINLWNPVKHDGDISTSNPCSEYLHLNNTSCNLASFNAYRLLDPETGTFDPDLLVHLSRLAMICADLNVERGGFPIPEIAAGTRAYRTTGIGYANVGGALMSLGIPYDSDEGRWVASQLVSLLTAACFKASAELGRELGPYPNYDATKDDLLEVVNLHAACQEIAGLLPILNEEQITKKIDELWRENQKHLPKSQGLTGRDAMLALVRSFVEPGRVDPRRVACAEKLSDRATQLWREVRQEQVFRNSFVSVMAPTGTISAPLGCYDEGTTSIEPDYTLVKYKQLSGGGMLKMFNRLALKGLSTLGYDAQLVREAAFECAGLDGLVTASGGVSSAANHLSKQLKEEQQGAVRAAFTRLTAPGRIEPSAIEALIVSLRSRNYEQNLSADEKLVLNGKSHLELVPYINPKDLAAFDCSVANGDGRRSIAAEGHMRMLGAIQPFISGASSKTVNLSYTATPADIKQCFVQCHQMGVKCIALFRAESKANSVYQVDTAEGRKLQPEYIWTEMVRSARDSMASSLYEAARPKRRKLKGRRTAQTVKFTVAGELRGYLTVGVYPDGRCGEIFGKVGQTGTFASGLLEAFCKSISVALQYGVPLDEMIQDFRYMAFEPSGFAVVGDDNDGERCEEIKSCSSLVDLIMRILDWLFPGPERFLAPMTNDTATFATTLGTATAQLERVTDNVNQVELPLPGFAKITPPVTKAIYEPVSNKAQASANLCPKCSQMTYIQDGKCRQCRNPSCGYKDGGCGE